MTSLPHIVAIHLYPTAGAAPVPVDAVELVASRGIVGDRYHAGVGSFSRWAGEGRDVTLIESEALDAAFAETGVDLRRGLSRRNVETRGVVLSEWVGRKFRLGTAVLRGARLCLPCMRLERLTAPGAFASLRRRGGLRANVLVGGTFNVGDAFLPA